MNNLLIWGAGDQGTVTLDCALAMKQFDRIDFLDFKEKGHRQIPDCLIYEEKNVNLIEFLKEYGQVMVASGDNYLRQKKISILDSIGVPIGTIIHPTAVISPRARISKGCTVLANAVVNTNASVGVGCIINTGAIVEHDCIVEDFVNISPRAAMAGHTVIGAGTFIGTGAVIIDAINIGRDAVIGAGCVVIRDIPHRAVAVGVPARVIKEVERKN